MEKPLNILNYLVSIRCCNSFIQRAERIYHRMAWGKKKHFKFLVQNTALYLQLFVFIVVAVVFI